MVWFLGKAFRVGFVLAESGDSVKTVYAMALFVLGVLLFAGVAGATAYTVSVAVKGPDGAYVEGAKVTLYNAEGEAYEGVTDASGVAEIEVPDNGTYLVVVEAGSYIILDSVNVLGDTNCIVDASTMHHANLTSTPIAVGVRVAYGTLKPSLNFTTNITVYAPSEINVTYPEEVVKLPFKYILKEVKVDGKVYEEASVRVPMTEDVEVTAVYQKTFPATLNFWLAILLAVVVVVAVVVAFIAAGRRAKETISEWRRSKMRFVERR